MALHQQKIYVGTSWGCLIITEAETLRPITVFRPFSNEVQAIIPVDIKPGRNKEESKLESYIVTLGKGYRALIKRYVSNMTSLASEDEDHDLSMIYAMLWQPDDWLTE